MQMACMQGSLRAASQVCSQLFEADDALRQHMLPCLELRSIMQLAGTCRAWHQHITDIPLPQLSAEARRAVLPSGLTSGLPLLQLVKQQAQLLARLRGKHGFIPRVQRLSFRDHLPDASPQVHAQPSDSEPNRQFHGILWSPCTRLEDASRWLTLQPALEPKNHPVVHHPIVVDTEAGRKVCFSEDLSSMLLAHGGDPWHYAAWLTDKSDRIVFFRVSGLSHGPIACLADAHGQGSLLLSLPGAQHCGSTRFFTVCSEQGSAVDVLCQVQILRCHGPDHRSEDQITVLDVSSRKLLYHLSCPKQLRQSFLQIQLEGNRQSQSASTNLKVGARMWRMLLAPNKQLLAVLWQCNVPLMLQSNLKRVICIGLSIHSATRGDLEHSTILPGGTSGHFDCRPSWLPCSSNIVYIGDGGIVHLMASSGRIMWSSARANRKQPLFTAGPFMATDLSASPCGRWLLVMDLSDSGSNSSRDGPINDNIWQITILEASTGQTLIGHVSAPATSVFKGSWSTSGEICLIEASRLALALVHSPRGPPHLSTFQLYELLGRAASDPFLEGPCIRSLSPSPCDSTVVGLEFCTGLQLHWRIPPSSTSGKEAALVPRPLQPVSLGQPLQRPRYTTHRAWHPLHGARIYAIFGTDGSLHLIDAKAHRCVWSWSRDELHGPATPSDSGQGDNISSANDYHNDSDDFIHPQLSWSSDGCRLAVISDSSLKNGARCSLLHLSVTLT